MSGSNSSSASPQHVEDDPLCITEKDRRQFNESEAIKRKIDTQNNADCSMKKLKTEENGIHKLEASDQELEKLVSEELEETTTISPPAESTDTESREDELIAKSEISVLDDNQKCMKSVLRSEQDQTEKQNEESNEIVEITKKEKKDLQERKVQNLRKNIKEVIDESQLDATTLAAQRQESERLARVQEQQRLIRETQRQIAAEKQANKTQQKVLSLLQGECSDPSKSEAFDLDDPILEKLTLSSAVSITPAAKAALQSIQSLISTDDQIPDSDSDDDDVVIQTDDAQEKSKAVVVDSSSDSDDCIILSDEEDEDVEEEDENNSGEHTNDVYNQKDAEGRVVVNIGHGENESKIYVAPQISRVIKHHQIGGVRFLFDNIIESIDLFDKSSGFGCILAHSMVKVRFIFLYEVSKHILLYYVIYRVLEKLCNWSVFVIFSYDILVLRKFLSLCLSIHCKIGYTNLTCGYHLPKMLKRVH